MGLREEGQGLPLCLMVEGPGLRSTIPREGFGLSHNTESPTLAAHILQVVVEVHGTSTQVAPQQRGVSGKDGGHRQAPGPAQAETNARQPFVEVGNHIRFLFILGQELWGNRDRVTVFPHSTKETSSNPHHGQGNRGEVSPRLGRAGSIPTKG